MDNRNSKRNRKVRGWTLGLLLGAGALFQVTTWSQAPQPSTPPGGAPPAQEVQPVQPAAPQPAPVQPEKAPAAPAPQAQPVQPPAPQPVPAQPEKATLPTPQPTPAQPANAESAPQSEKVAVPTPLPGKTFPERVDGGGTGREANKEAGNKGQSKSASGNKENGDKAAAGKDEDVKIRLNFRGAELDTVLNYLSEAAGFIISREVEVKGKIDVWSEQPISRDEALELLNTVLNVKGYATSRNGRILRIVKRDEAKFENLPVHIGSDPEQIPESEEIVTQIIPIRSTDATKLTQTLQPLLPDYSIMTPNAGSNSIVLTDTQLNIRRMCKIIKGLDSTVSNILDVKVYQLKNADATAVASMIEKVLQPPTSSGSGSGGDRRGGGGPGEFFMRMRGGFGGGDQQGGESSGSEARSAASKIVAMPDTRTNSVVVNAPAETHAAIQALVNQIDTMAQDVTNLRVFPLQYADAETLAKTLTSLFTASTSTSNQNQQGMGGGRMPPWMRQPETQSDSSKSDRAVLEAKVTIVAEAQTNSLIVSASESSMSAVETLIKKFDTPPNGVTDVRIYKLQYADSEELASTLSSLFQARTTGSSSTSRGGNMGFGGGMFGGGMFGGMQGRGNQSSSTTSKSDRQKQTEQINVVAEAQTNSLIVEAAEDSFPLVEKLIRQFDTKSDQITETQMFPLKYADATELADTLMYVFNGQSSGYSSYGGSRSSSSNRSSSYGNRNSMSSFGNNRRSSYGGMSSSSSTRRSSQEDTVIIVADERTNSIIANATADTLKEIAQTIAKLDSNPARDQKVFVYKPRNADPTEVQTIIQNMFPTSTSNSSSRNRSTSRNSSSSNRSNSSSSSNRNNSSNRNSSSNRSSGSSSGFGSSSSSGFGF